LDYFPDELRAALAEPRERLVDVVDGEHDAQVAEGVHRGVPLIGDHTRREKLAGVPEALRAALRRRASAPGARAAPDVLASSKAIDVATLDAEANELRGTIRSRRTELASVLGELD
jgi:hypothetical protein